RASDGMSSLFAITSVPGAPLLERYLMEYHRGAPCPWSAQAASEEAVVSGPSGHLFYMDAQREPLVLIGSGVAPAPLLGVLRTAVRLGHQAPIVFIRLVARSDNHFRRCLKQQAALADCNVRCNEVTFDMGNDRR